jgi:hypothetical protein
VTFRNFGIVAENVQPDAIQPKTHPTRRNYRLPTHDALLFLGQFWIGRAHPLVIVSQREMPALQKRPGMRRHHVGRSAARPGKLRRDTQRGSQ